MGGWKIHSNLQKSNLILYVEQIVANGFSNVVLRELKSD